MIHPVAMTRIAALLLVFAPGLGAAHAADAADDDAKSLALDSADGKPVLIYNAAYLPSPDAKQPWYGRSGFIHPVYTPAGRIVTDDFPADHLHQHGLMFAWTTATYEGRKIDFWNSKKREGHVEHAETVQADADTIIVKLRHVDDTADKPTAILHETWKITRVPHDSMNVFDIESTQTCATDKPVVMRKYHYGGMAIRGAASWMDDKGMMVTNEGKDREAGNHTRPNWVAMSGNVDGAPCGIAAMGHPDNFRAPQPVRLHPNKPYFCFAPMVLGEFSIEPGKPYVSRFRFVTFDGKPDIEALNKMWGEYTGE